MNAFIDVNGVLKAYGYMESNNDDQLIEVGDDFNYIPGTVRWDGTNWVPYVYQPPLPVLAEAKRNEIRSACSDEITRSSFQSSSLGAVHNYDCRLVDQVNLKMRLDIADATSSSEPLWASDGTRYQWKLHTATEIRDVMIDMNEHIKDAQVKLASLMAAVDAATNKAQIDVIVW